MSKTSESYPLIGWREWLGLPDLRVERIKAKIDTGARTSALHAFFVDPYRRGARQWVRFGIHPFQRASDTVIECDTVVKDRRLVSDSGGHRCWRFVIETRIVIGRHCINAEINLTDRDTMIFRMLLGRTALDGRFLIDPSVSYLLGRPGSPGGVPDARGANLRRNP